MFYKQKTKIKGYHGTSLEHKESIVNNNFKESTNDEWFGDAVYFFIEGISIEKPYEHARNFAIDSSWNNDLKNWNYDHYLVFEVEMKMNEDKLLDMTISDGVKLFNEYRLRYIQMLEDNGKKVYGKILDAHIINTMRTNLGIEFVKGNVYIKFGSQRKQKIDSRIPNVTIFAVNNPAKNITKSTIKEYSKGKIS